MFVYFCYVGMEFENVTIVKQYAIYSISTNFLTPKFSQNVVLGLNINIRQKSGKYIFDGFCQCEGATLMALV